MGKYKKCPRCELNYIALKESYCNVCKAELKLVPSSFLEDGEEEELDILCPVCKINYIGFDEDMCSVCREKSEKESVFAEEDDETWRTYLDDEKEEILPILDETEVSLSELEEEELEEDEEEEFSDIDDFENIDDFDDDELDEEDEFEDEEDE